MQIILNSHKLSSESNKMALEYGSEERLGDDHLILRGGGWHFLEINILTPNMLEIKYLASTSKKINNLTSTVVKIG